MSELCEALKKRLKFVEVSSMRSFDSLLEEVYRTEPRLSGCVAGYEGKAAGSGMLGLNRTYSLEIRYADDTVEDFDRVVLDDGAWKPSDALAAAQGVLPVIQVVTQDLNSLEKRIGDDMNNLKERCPGMVRCRYAWSEKCSNGYASMWIKPEFAVDDAHYKMYQTLAQREMERIDSRFFGKGGNIPKLMKVFLAFSYLQQSCGYDQESADLISAGQPELMQCPWTTLPYGALVKKTAICEGIAAAYKMFMDYYGIENRIVFGAVGDEQSEHCWNMVCLDGKHYHVDATAGLTGDGVYIGAFLKSDAQMSSTHLWDVSRYPACTSTRVDFDNVENYVSEHMDELLRMGVEERFMCPAEIRE